jgi:hypothetical protein
MDTNILHKWIRPLIKRHPLTLAFFAGGHDTEAVVLIKNFLTDPRMQRVWDELFRRTADKRQYYYRHSFAERAEAKDSLARCARKKADALGSQGLLSDKAAVEYEIYVFETLADVLREESELKSVLSEDAQHEEALGLFFDAMFHWARWPDLASKVADDQVSPGGSCGTLRQEADKLEILGLTDEAAQVRRIAAFCQEWAQELIEEEEDALQLPRKTARIAVRSYVIQLSRVSKELFGKPLYGTLATISNVVFPSVDLRGADVREMVRAAPPEKMSL